MPTDDTTHNECGTASNTFAADVRRILHHPPDLVIRSFQLSPYLKGDCIFIETLVDTVKIERDLLQFMAADTVLNELDTAETIVQSLQSRIPFSTVAVSDDLSYCTQSLMSGTCLLALSNSDQILLLDSSKTPSRSVSEPLIESTVQGPEEGFTENINVNISLVRKRIKSVHFRIEQFIIGTDTETKVHMLFMENVAPVEVVEEFRSRIRSIQIDSVLDSNYIEEWIQDKTLSPFTTLLNTERPDIVAANVLEGRVCVLVDGSPDSLIGPVTFFQSFISPEDYYQRADIATILRLLRILSFLLAVFVPALYVAIVSYHQELLPHPLLINISAQREGVPFPAIVEALLMMVTFEVLREAGLRMPRIAGQAISIVGALVLGEAAVTAGLVSAAMVIVVAVTAISNFVAPAYNFSITQRMLQFFYMILAGSMGLFGVFCGVLFTVVHLASMKSFGVPYLSPVAPAIVTDWKDTLIRVPRQWMKSYPKMNPSKKKRRGSS